MRKQRTGRVVLPPGDKEVISLSVNPSTPEELDATIKSEVARWNEVIREAGIKAVE